MYIIGYNPSYGVNSTSIYPARDLTCISFGTTLPQNDRVTIYRGLGSDYTEENLTLVGVAENLIEAVKMVRSVNPDIPIPPANVRA